jgi:glycosyltransferase involved in cell wall biosynthesis
MNSRDLYFGIAPAPYRVDLCNWLYTQGNCEIFHLEHPPDVIAFDLDALKGEIVFDYKTYPSISFSLHSIRFLSALIDRYQPLKVYVSEFSATCILMCLLKRLKKKEFQVISFCDDSPDMIAGNDYSRRHRVARRFVPHLVDNLILCNTETVCWYQHRFGKGVYFPIIADERRFREKLVQAIPKAEMLLDTYELWDKPVILYVGRLVPQKQVDFILRAYAPLKDRVRLVVVGEGECRSELESMDRELNLNVIFTGCKSGEDLLAWYVLGDILLLPSRVEAFGAVVNEALMAGLAPIVSDRVGSNDLIAEDAGAVLPVDTPARWTVAIQERIPPILPKRAPMLLKPCRMPFSFESALNRMVASL